VQERGDKRYYKSAIYLALIADALALFLSFLLNISVNQAAIVVKLLVVAYNLLIIGVKRVKHRDI
jgi:hypothetical protein